MHSPIPTYLDEVLARCAGDVSGELASYIPELAEADPDQLAVALATVDGILYAVGDVETEFTIQSISKPFTYALALADRGLAEVLDRIDVEPSGEAFNEMSLEQASGRPLNAMINAGAITAHSLVGPAGLSPRERLERVLVGLSAFAGRRLEVDESAFRSELATAHRNLAIAHMLRGHGVLTEDPVAVVEGYTGQCWVLVTVRDLALMAGTLANGGVQPLTGEQVVPGWVVRHVLSVMTTCGMYDSAGDWVTTVGIPAKSGVGGGLIGALPGQVGVATFSPRLDEHGTSVRGVQVFEQLSADMGMHLMEVPPPARSVLRDVEVLDDGTLRVYHLQGGIQFSGAERVARTAVDDVPTEPRVALDLTLVHAVNRIARRMLLEVVRRLSLDGIEVFLVDPESLLPDPDPGPDGRVRVVTTVAELVGSGGSGSAAS